MFRPVGDTPASSSAATVANPQDLHAVISTALAANPVDEDSLRCAVWTYVGAARQLGTSPGRVIVALYELIQAPHVVPMAISQALRTRVIVWCVEACFGHLAGDVYHTLDTGPATAPVLALVR